MTRARELSKFQAGANITANTAFLPDTADGATLGTSALEFSDLFLADSGTIKFGADQDVTLDHLPDTGLNITTTNTTLGGALTHSSLKFGGGPNILVDSITDRSSSESLLAAFDVLYMDSRNIKMLVGTGSSNYFKISEYASSGPTTTDKVTYSNDVLELATDVKLGIENSCWFGPNGFLVTDKAVVQSVNRDINLIAYKGEVHIKAGTTTEDYGGRTNVVVKDTGVELYGGAGSSNTPIKYFQTDVNGPQLSPGDGTAKVGVGTMAGVIHGSYDTEFNIGGTNHSRLKLNATAYGTTANDGLDLYVYQTSSSLLNRENGYLRFGTNSTIRMMITNTGNVGINNTSPSYTLDVNGSARFVNYVVFNTHAYFGDSDVIYMGAGNDLRLYHNGTDSYVHNTTGNLLVQSGANAYMLVNGSENAVACVANGAVGLYHNNVEKLVTSSGGVSVTGTVTATSFSGDGSSLSGVGGSTATNAVGTYGMFVNVSGSGVSEGDTRAASSIKFSAANGAFTNHPTGGTWRSMGRMGTATGTNGALKTTIMVRIS